MRERFAAVLMAALLLVSSAAFAQDYVSIAELHNQAASMENVWRKTFDTPYGEMTVHALIIVPDIEKLAVLTVEKAKISEELYNRIIQGKKGGNADQIQYDEVELNGKVMEFFLGEENYYIFGEQTDNTGYDAVQTLWIQHGEFRFSTGSGLMQKARPITYHDIQDVDMDKAYMRGTDQTTGDIMRLWREDIRLCLGEGFEIRPTNIEVKGSMVIKSPGEGKVYRRKGYTYVYAEQILEGLPVFGAIALGGFSVPHGATAETNRQSDQLRPYRIGVNHCETRLTAIGSDEESYRTMTDLVKVRTIEYEDIPVAPLESVLANIEKEIEEGRIRSVKSIRLGYILYSNPDMIDYAWAVPRWTVECEYVSDKERGGYARWKERESGETKLAPTLEDDAVYVYTGEMAPDSGFYHTMIPVDAQSGEPIIFTIGDEKVFAVSEIKTWKEAE